MNHENYTKLPVIQNMLLWNPQLSPACPRCHPRHWWLHWRERHWPFPLDGEAGPMQRSTLKKSMGGFSGDIMVIGLILGRIYRKPWSLPLNMGVSCKFSCKPIQWHGDVLGFHWDILGIHDGY
jgi:hypothetical protein